MKLAESKATCRSCSVRVGVLVNLDIADSVWGIYFPALVDNIRRRRLNIPTTGITRIRYAQCEAVSFIINLPTSHMNLYI